MAEKTFQEYSDAAKLHWEAREFVQAGGVLTEARAAIAVAEGQVINQRGDGSLVLQTEVLNVDGEVTGFHDGFKDVEAKEAPAA